MLSARLEEAEKIGCPEAMIIINSSSPQLCFLADFGVIKNKLGKK